MRRDALKVCSFIALLCAASMSAQNPLPPPNHPLLFAYYNADSRYGAYYYEQSCYTNAVRVGADDYNQFEPGSWETGVNDTLQRAAADNKRIILSMALNKECWRNGAGERDCSVILSEEMYRIDVTLLLAAPYWHLVDMIELGDEAEWGPAAAINLRIDRVAERIAAFGLAAKPASAFGSSYNVRDIAVLGLPQEGGNRVLNSRLGWVSLHAYVDPPESSLASCDNISILRRLISDARARIPGKNIGLVMMAYDRNGCWNAVNTIPNLVDLQNATYELAYNDPAVVALTMFSYGRQGCTCNNPPCGGTRTHPELAAAHRQMGERILGLGSYPACGPGPYSYVAPASCTPGAPQNLQASVNGFRVSLTWKNTGGSQIGVQRMANSSGVWSQIAMLPSGASAYHDDVPPLPSGSSVVYSYRVYSTNEFGSSRFSNVVSVTLWGDIPAVPIPIAPQGCVNTINPTYSWQAASRATRYYIAVTRADIESFFINDSNVTATSYYVTSNLLIGVQYRWKVKACNNRGCSDWTPSIYFKPYCSGVASTITEPLGCIRTQVPTFRWTAVPGVNHYWLLVGSSPDFSASTTIRYVDVHLGGTSYAPGIAFAPLTTYYAKVKSIPDPGSTTNAAWSQTISFTPLCADSSPP